MNCFIKRFAFIILLTLITFSCKEDQDNQIQQSRAENRKALGSSAEDLLSDDSYRSMTVEMVYSPAYKPTQQTLDAFMTFINARVNKPDGVSFIE
ncbi:membrane metalloprotease, partial [bacterium]|nr:membrane metalloprotease [bacterium]